jgi:hypothetical protein
MKIKNIKTKTGQYYDSFIEIELDNGEFIFCNDYISGYRRAEKPEDIEKFEEDFSVLNSSIIDMLDDDEKSEEVWCNYDKYAIIIKDVEKYNSYLDILLEAWKVVEREVR